MSRPTIATLCTGGALVEVGAIEAGLRPIWGVEIDDQIAEVGRDNGLHVITGDVCAMDYTALEFPDVLHASPPCPNFSVAKQGRVESAEDTRIARAVAAALANFRPTIFTLENVWGYRLSESWGIIASALDGLGYMWSCDYVSAADCGVPQTRKRMWVRAVRDSLLLPLPQPEPWRGWYQAVEDLLPGCPESALADWQERGLPGWVREFLGCRPLLVDSAGYPGCGGERIPVCRRHDEPAGCVVANHGRRPLRAVLIGKQYSNGWQSQKEVQAIRDGRPAPTVTNNVLGRWRAILANSRTVALTPRCKARLQSIPDSYQLPENNELAGRIIGNAVPPLLYRRLIADLVAAAL